MTFINTDNSYLATCKISLIILVQFCKIDFSAQPKFPKVFAKERARMHRRWISILSKDNNKYSNVESHWLLLRGKRVRYARENLQRKSNYGTFARFRHSRGKKAFKEERKSYLRYVCIHKARLGVL